MTFDIGDNLANILIALIAAIPAIIAARYAYKANDTSEKTRVNVDGKMDTLLEASIGRAKAEGIIEGTISNGPQDVSIVNPDPVPVVLSDDEKQS